MMSTETDLQKAQKFMKLGNIEYNKFDFFGLRDSHFSVAADYYIKAGTFFQIAKMWNDAANAYILTADCYTKLSNSNEVFNYKIWIYYLEAAKCYKRENNLLLAIKTLQIVRTNALENFKFNDVAKYSLEIAEIYESLRDYNNALYYYKDSFKYYEVNENNRQMEICSSKINTLSKLFVPN